MNCYELLIAGMFLGIVMIILWIARHPELAVIVGVIGVVMVFEGYGEQIKIHVPGYQPTAEEREWHDNYDELFGIDQSNCPWRVEK